MVRTNRKQPPLRVSVRPVNVESAERESRLRRAFDVVFDEILERRVQEDKQENKHDDSEERLTELDPQQGA